MNLKARIPVLPRNSSSATGCSESFVSDQAAKVLIADDDENVLYALTTLLARAGFSVTAVFGGEQAWEMLRHENYNLLVTHNEMMGTNLIERIRDAGMSLPVIMASGSFSENTARDHPQLQIAAIIPKPPTRQNL